MSRARDVANFIPPAGVVGEVLQKASTDDYDTAWGIVPGSLPPITPGGDQGTALVIDATDTPAWGAIIDSDVQIIDGGDF